METKKIINCIIVGEGNLPLKCMGILKDYKIQINALVSPDSWLLQQLTDESFPKYTNLNDLSVFQPVDFIFSINNSLILKKNFTSLARTMAINYHDAPLPRYAGMYASNWAILNSETEHGISWHEVVDEIDAGDVVASQLLPVFPNDTALSLNTRCFEAALKSFEELVISIVEERLNPVPQNLEKRTYYPLGARPELFGLITSEMNIDKIDALIRTTNFSSHYPNEFALPMLFAANNFYIVAKASVLKDQTGQAGLVVDIEGKRGFNCVNGVVFPEIVYDRLGNKVNPELILPIGTKMPIPDELNAEMALKQFGCMARFEPFWRKQLAQAEYITWPLYSGENCPSSYTSQLYPHTISLIEKLYPNQKADHIISAVFMLFFLRLANQTSGSLGYSSQLLKSKVKDIEEFISSWVPFNCTYNPSDFISSVIEKIISHLVRLEKSESFSCTTRIRYPELRSNSTDQPEIILSTYSYIPSTNSNKSIKINISKNSINYIFPANSKFAWSESFADSFLMFLDNVLKDKDQPVSQISYLSLEKSQALANFVNKPICEAFHIEDVVHSFNAISKLYPDRIAIFDSGNTFNYSTFANDIEQLSERIFRAGIRANEIVAVAIDRKYHYFVAIMATLRCGASFLPIDSAMPIERKQFLCTDSGASLILSDNTTHKFIDNIPTLNLSDSESNRSTNLESTIYNPESVAYIIYTSGSTGIPKGVKISRKALANFISGALGLYKMDSNDKVLQFSSLAFDASIEEIFCSFCSGASLYLRTSEMLLADEMVSFSHLHQISVWDLPTAYWRQVLQSEAYQNKSLPESLRLVIIGGEAVSTNDVALWNKTNSNHRLINSYGPTETTVVSLAYEISPGFIPESTVPIGQPLSGYKLYITDQNRQIVPIGIAGELLVAGDSLALGYLNREPEQKKAFIDFNTPENGAQQCYCTGDLVTVGSDGLIYYQGRVDNQVKIRGYRVEPGEIEQQIMAINGVETCLVAVAANVSGEKSLFAFFICKNNEINAQQIKEELKIKLPTYMIPEIILKVDEIPLTSNGKADRKKLIELAKENQSHSTGKVVDPTNETEEFLLYLWKKILAIETMGIDDDFFDLGGHSLKAVQLMAELKKQKDLTIPLASLIQNSTVRTFAHLITSEDKNSLWECLVQIRPKGTKTPLFLIHGAGLNILLYQSLTQYLKDDRPIYAFQAKGLDGNREISNSIEEMADDYIQEIKKVQPNGPYMLLGFSLGGFIVYDMAKKLSQKGDKVCFAGVIDSVSSMAKHLQSPKQERLFKLKTTTIKPFYVTWLLLKEPWDGKRRLFHNKYKSIRFSIIFKLIQLGILKEKERKIKLEDGQPMFLSDNVEIAMTEALIRYVIKPADIQLDLFRAGKPTFYIPNRKDYGWGRFARKGVIVHTLPDEHSRIFAPPNDKYFAQVLDKRLDEIETNLNK